MISRALRFGCRSIASGLAAVTLLACSADAGTSSPGDRLCQQGAQCDPGQLLPEAPTSLAAIAGDTQVTLTWTGIDGALTYNVYVAQISGGAASAAPVSVASSPHVRAGLINGVEYYFAVSAVFDAGEGSLSHEVSATPRISAPTQLSVRGGDHQVSLEWEAVSGAGAYNLYWAVQPGVSLSSAVVSDLTSVSFDHAQLDNSTTYYYALTAVDGLSESELSVEMSASTMIEIQSETRQAAFDAQGDDSLGWSVAVSGDFAIVGAYSEDGGDSDPFVDAGVAYVHKRTGSNSWDAGTRLVASDAQAGDRFGWSVAVSGDFAIVGAYGEDGGESDPASGAGAAYVFHYDGSSWDAGTKLSAPDAQSSDKFGYAVAVSGDFAIVGAHGEDGGDFDPLGDAGAAYVFHYNGSSWDAGIKLVAPDAQQGDEFGAAVAISAAVAIVGARGKDGGDDTLKGAGAAYVYVHDGSSWDAGTKLEASDAQPWANFGYAVSLGDDFAVVGAPWADNEGESEPVLEAGAAYVYHRNGPTSWDAGTRLVAPDAEAHSRFAYSVAVSGDYIVVGAPWRQGSSDNSSVVEPMFRAGVAHTFWFSGSTWSSGPKLEAPDAQERDEFGSSVALGGGWVIVGAPKEDGGQSDPLADAGAVYFFEY